MLAKLLIFSEICKKIDDNPSIICILKRNQKKTANKCRQLADVIRRRKDTKYTEGIKSASGDFLCHLIEGDALGAGNGAFVGIVHPWREDEQAACGDSIEEEVGGFKVIAKAVVREIDDIAIVMKERVEHFLFIARDERRDHDCAFGGGIETACFVVFEGLVVTMFGGILDPHAADVDGLAELLHEDTDITDGIVGTTVDLDVVLDAEEAGFEALGSETSGVHVEVADSSG